MKTNTIIKINGKSYDAITGKPIHGASTIQAAVVRSIDGVMRSADAAPVGLHNKAAATVSVPKTSAPHRKAHVTAPAPKTQKTHSSKTLMRHVVHKPLAATPKHFKSQGPTNALISQPVVKVVPKLSIAAIDKRREARAKRIAKSKLISRFGSLTISEQPVAGNTAAVSISLPVQVSASVKPSTTIPTRAAHHDGPKSMDIFQKALQQASKHELQPAPAKKRAYATSKKHRRPRAHRLANASAAALAVVVVGGFLAYQNIANVTLRLASSKAGFAASMPAYRPSGFSVGKFAYSPGNVTINFHSNSDARSYAVAEKPSSWDSQTLLNDYVAANSQTFQTVQSSGRTIYVYDKTKATWVNNGVWYVIDSNADLSSSQLVSLAASM